LSGAGNDTRLPQTGRVSLKTGTIPLPSIEREDSRKNRVKRGERLGKEEEKASKEQSN